MHAVASLQELHKAKSFNEAYIHEMLNWYIAFRKHLLVEIRHSRQKDYDNPFRQMLYADKKEMEAVIGKLDKTPFIVQQEARLKQDLGFIQNLKNKWNLAD